MTVRILVNTAQGNNPWTLVKEWGGAEEAIFPVGIKDKFNRLYCFLLGQREGGDWEISMTTSDDEGLTWTPFSVIVSGVKKADIGATYDKNFGENGRIYIAYWKSVAGVDREFIGVSDDRGASFSETELEY